MKLAGEVEELEDGGLRGLQQQLLPEEVLTGIARHGQLREYDDFYTLSLSLCYEGLHLT